MNLERYEIEWTRQAIKDLKLLSQKPALLKNLERFLELISENPYRYQFPFEALMNDLQGTFSVRLNIQHRLWYTIEEESKTVVILRIWGHYG